MCQTSLSIPFDFDLHKISTLKRFFNKKDLKINKKSSNTVRKKLVFDTNTNNEEVSDHGKESSSDDNSSRK